MLFNELLNQNSVCLDTSAQSKSAVLLKVSQILHQNYPSLNANTLFAAYWKRESLGSTAIGHGIIIPHVRSGAIQKSCAAMLKLHHPVDFDAQDKQPVDLVFALVIPQQQTDRHLQTLTKVIKLFSDPIFRSNCRAAKDPSTLYQLFVNYELQTIECVELS
jgi:PTS system nitrogen regulatory IIA component